MFRRLPAILLCAILIGGCQTTPDARFADPASTFRSYRQSLSAGDAELSWDCLGRRYQEAAFDGDLERWRAFVSADAGRQLALDLDRREIAGEQQINDRVGFLQFDPTTVPDDVGPFFYFVKEDEGWKITTHTDSLFRAELESAIERGEFVLPR